MVSGRAVKRLCAISSIGSRKIGTHGIGHYSRILINGPGLLYFDARVDFTTVRLLKFLTFLYDGGIFSMLHRYRHTEIFKLGISQVLFIDALTNYY